MDVSPSGKVAQRKGDVLMALVRNRKRQGL
jgi:hypothetical protein